MLVFKNAQVFLSFCHAVLLLLDTTVNLVHVLHEKKNLVVTEVVPKFRSNVEWHSKHMFGELIYTCKIGFLAGSNLQVRNKPDIFSGFSQPEHFSSLKPDHLLLNRARFAGDNLCYNLTFLAGLNLQVQTWIKTQVSPDNPILQV